MTVNVEDIHPQLSEAYRQKVMSDLKQGSNVVVQAGNSAGCTANFVLFGTGIASCWLNEWLGFIIIFISLTIHPVVKSLAIKQLSLQNLNHPQMITSVLSAVAKTDAEKTYVSNTISLLNMDQVNNINTQKIMNAMNSLLSDYYFVEEQFNKVKAAQGENTSSRLREEIKNINWQLSGSDDEFTVDALKNRLKMCEAQMHDVKAIEKASNRLLVQGQVIRQGLSSIGSTLGRMQISTLPMSTPDVTVITDIVTEINQQTKAVEDAVQEIVILCR